MRRFMPIACLLGCTTEFGVAGSVGDTPPRNVASIEEEFVQAALPAADILFVVDDTPSMAQEQAALAVHFTRVTDTLEAAGVRWHLGVVRGTVLSDRAGWLVGEPWLLSPGDADAAQLFAQNFIVGGDGTGPEAGFAAASLALEMSLPGGPNAGFRRPDAVLHLVFVSDDDDASEAYFPTDPTDGLIGVLEAEAESTGLPVRVSAIVGDLPGGCTSATGDARPGFRYHEVVEATGGVARSVCSDDVGDVLDDIGGAAVAWQTRFELRHTPQEGSVRVRVDGAVVTSWTLVGTTLVFDAAPAPDAAIRVEYLVEVAP